VTEAERLAEIDRLVEEQRKDDTNHIEHEYMGRFRALSLDASVSESDWLGVEIDGVTRIPVHDLNPRARRGMYCGGGLAQIPHGTMNGYKNYGCRCRPCTVAHTAYLVPKIRAYRQRKLDERPDRTCANETCSNVFRPVPSTKVYCSHRCADTARKRVKRRELAAA
jgi:hypothetical protein